MAFQIGNLFNNVNRPVGDVSQVSPSSPVSSSEGEASGGKVLSSLTPGSSLTGQVLSTEEGNVTIRLADNSTISAALKGAIALEAGNQVTFTVSSNKNNNIVLSPLFTNLNASPNVENALHAAELPVNAETAAMVETMMKNGMGIDKDSLVSMYKNLANNPGVDITSAVKLTQMGLQINELNAENLSNYESLNHQLSEAAGKIGDDIADALKGFTEADIATGKEFLNGLTEIIADEAGTISEGVSLPGEEGKEVVNPEGGKGADNPVLTEEAVKNGEIPAQKEAVTADKAVLSGNETVIKENAESGAVKTAEAGQDNAAKTVNPEVDPEKTSARALLGDDGLKDLLRTLKQAGADDNVLRTLTRSETNVSEALKTVNDILQNTENPAMSKAILNHPALGRLIKEGLSDQFLLKPETFADKEKVEQFYERLRTQGGRMFNLAEQTLGKESALSQSTGALNQNIDFINQLNQSFTYVQIPLKLENQNANGDLYVYANKKSLADKDGSLSAFLHLDMDNLGSVDVYVTMQKEKVSTNFKVADDSVLDLIEAHIDELNERLSKKGYNMNMTVAVKSDEEETSAIKEMQKDIGAMPVAISHLSFDARA